MAIDPNDLAIHDEIVIETEIDGAPVRLSAFITNVLAGELWLATRLPDERLPNLEEGQPIHLTFDRGGALIVESSFVRRLGGTKGKEVSRVFAVRRPEGVESVQRRAHVRVDLERQVRIKAMGTLGSDKIGTGRTTNIGAGGVQFITEMPLLFGEQLRLALVLTSRDIVVAGGAVVRIEDGGQPIGAAGDPGGETGAGKSRVAVRFDKIAEADQERITCHILSARRLLSATPSTPQAAPVRIEMPPESPDAPEASPPEAPPAAPASGDAPA